MMFLWIKFKIHVPFLKENRIVPMAERNYSLIIKLFTSLFLYFLATEKMKSFLFQLKEDENVRKITEIFPPLHSLFLK